MKISFEAKFIDQIKYISNDKPQAARKFKNDLLKNLIKDLKQPFQFKKLDIMITKILDIMFLKGIFQSMK